MKLDKNNTGFAVIEEGEYEVYPHAFSKEKAQTSGNKMVVFNYIIRDDVDQKFKGQQIRFDNFVETEGAMWRINQASEAAGLDMEKEYPGGVYEWAEDFVNKAIRVTVGHRTYNGRTYPEVTGFKNSLVGGVYVPKDKDANNPVAQAKGEEVAISDDDLPF